MRSNRAFGALLLAAGLGVACVGVSPHGVTYVRVRPPRAVVEIRAESPGRGHVWIPGYHRWDGGAHVWVPGHWERVPAGRRHWVPGRWRSHRGQWYWVEGHWR
jgi:hypothetical protein